MVNNFRVRFEFGHVTCFPPSNFAKSKNKNVYIIIVNGYTTKQYLEVSLRVRSGGGGGLVVRLEVRGSGQPFSPNS